MTSFKLKLLKRRKMMFGKTTTTSQEKHVNCNEKYSKEWKQIGELQSPEFVDKNFNKRM